MRSSCFCAFRIEITSSASPRAVWCGREHHYSLPHTQRLQAQFAVGITRILSGNGKPSEHRFAANKVEAMLFNVGLAWRLTSSYVTIHKL